MDLGGVLSRLRAKGTVHLERQLDAIWFELATIRRVEAGRYELATSLYAHDGVGGATVPRVETVLEAELAARIEALLARGFA